MKALIDQGVDEKKRIIGTDAPHPFLFNLSFEMIERFRQQLSLIDIQFEGDPELIRKAVWSCYQESPVEFRGYSLTLVHIQSHLSLVRLPGVSPSLGLKSWMKRSVKAREGRKS